jgi:hypothetical protein
MYRPNQVRLIQRQDGEYNSLQREEKQRGRSVTERWDKGPEAAATKREMGSNYKAFKKKKS